MHALVLFSVFLNNKQKMSGGPCTYSLYPPKFIYISIYFGQKTFSPNLMINITGTFRNTSNCMK